MGAGDRIVGQRALALEDLPGKVALVDADGQIVEVNQRFCTRLGLSADQTIGRALQSRVHPSDHAELTELLAAAAAEGQASADLRLVAADGSLREVSCGAHRLGQAGLASAGYCLVFFDLTPHKRVERELESYASDLEQLYLRLEQRSDALLAANEQLRQARERTERAEELTRLEQMKTAFLDVAAHELRTPVAMLTGALSCLARGLPDEGRVVMMDAAQRSLQRLTSVLDNALKLLASDAVPLRVRYRPYSLAVLLREAADDARTLSACRKLNISVDVDPDLPDVEVDVSQLHDVAANLLINAIKFTPDGGTVAVTAGACPDRHGCWFSVSDTGVGIPEDERPFIFDRFFGTFETKHHSSGSYEFGTRGPGFGLALVQKFVQLHHGSVTVETKPGRGSCFTVRLPLRQPASEPNQR